MKLMKKIVGALILALIAIAIPGAVMLRWGWNPWWWLLFMALILRGCDHLWFKRVSRKTSTHYPRARNGNIYLSIALILALASWLLHDRSRYEVNCNAGTLLRPSELCDAMNKDFGCNSDTDCVVSQEFGMSNKSAQEKFKDMFNGYLDEIRACSCGTNLGFFLSDKSHKSCMLMYSSPSSSKMCGYAKAYACRSDPKCTNGKCVCNVGKA